MANPLGKNFRHGEGENLGPLRPVRVTSDSAETGIIRHLILQTSWTEATTPLGQSMERDRRIVPHEAC